MSLWSTLFGLLRPRAPGIPAVHMGMRPAARGPVRRAVPRPLPPPPPEDIEIDAVAMPALPAVPVPVDPALLAFLSTNVPISAALTANLAPLAAVASLPTTTVPLDMVGAAHMTPGDMGTIVQSQPYVHVDMIVDGGGHFTSFSSTNEAVISSLALSNDVLQSAASAGIRSPGQTMITATWVDITGTTQTSTITVVAN